MSMPLVKKALLLLAGLWAVFLCIELWEQLPTYWLKLNRLQRDVVDSLSEYLMLVSQGNLNYGWYMLALGFLYGLLHSVSPGHGKTAVISISVINQYRRRKAIQLVAVIAILQAVSACLLFGLAAALSQSFSHHLADHVRWLTQACAVLIVLLGFKELLKVVIRILTKARPSEFTNIQGSGEASYKALLLIGLRPCTGAILVLFLSNLLGSLWWGIASTFMMASGTAMTNSLLVFQALTAKQRFERITAGRHDRLLNISSVVLSLAMLCSGLLLFSFAKMSGLQSFIR